MRDILRLNQYRLEEDYSSLPQTEVLPAYSTQRASSGCSTGGDLAVSAVHAALRLVHDRATREHAEELLRRWRNVGAEDVSSFHLEGSSTVRVEYLRNGKTEIDSAGEMLETLGIALAHTLEKASSGRQHAGEFVRRLPIPELGTQNLSDFLVSTGAPVARRRQWPERRGHLSQEDDVRWEFRRRIYRQA